jgi:FkbM family methyltransferase
LNGFENKICVLPYACGETNGSSSLIVDPLLPGTASACPEIQRTIHGDTLPIEIRPVDDLDLPPPNFIKIDVEGMEFAALQGMEKTLQRHRPELYIELHGATADHKRENARAVIGFLDRRGYRMQWLEGE